MEYNLCEFRVNIYSSKPLAQYNIDIIRIDMNTKIIVLLSRFIYVYSRPLYIANSYNNFNLYLIIIMICHYVVTDERYYHFILIWILSCLLRLLALENVF